MSRPMMLSAVGLKKRFGSRTVVDVDRFDAPAGSTVAVIGPSGAGKTTLLAILGLLEKPHAGQVYLDGAPVGVRDKAARMNMAAAFQSPYLFKASVAENVAFGLKLRKVPAAERRRLVESSLARIGLEGWESRDALTLSGGEAQRVALARALVLRPRVLFLDEPFASLDPLVKGHLVFDLARIIREDEMTTIYVTHDHAEAMSIADRVMVMREGRSVAHGPSDEVMKLPPDQWTADFLGAGRPLRGVVAGSVEGVLSIDVSGVHIHAVGVLPEGEKVLVGVRPEDVLLFDGDAGIPRSSARNRFHAVVVELKMWGVMHQVTLDLEGALLTARVSNSSVREMGLSPGMEVQVVFKATAVRVRSESSGSGEIP